MFAKGGYIIRSQLRKTPMLFVMLFVKNNTNLAITAFVCTRRRFHAVRVLYNMDTRMGGLPPNHS